MKYIAKGEHNRHFELFAEDGRSLGRVDYDGWFSVHVDLVVGDDVYSLGASNFWNTSFQVVKNDNVVAELKVNWWNNLVIEMTGGATYLFKHDFWPHKYTLYTEHEKPIVRLEQDFVLSKFSFNYEMETDDNYSEANNPLLLLMLIYCCNHRHGRVATGGV